MTLPVACSIAGSDSGGGAGIRADLKTFDACGVYGATVIVALTAQNTVGVRAIEPVATAMIGAQIDAVAEDFDVAAWKTGMLGSAETIAVVVERLRRHRVSALVVDPVMVAKSGDRLLAEDAVDALRSTLLPLARVVTPNALEAAALLRRRVDDIDDARAAARGLCELGPAVAVVKGGHLAGERVVDVVVEAATGRTVELIHPRVDGTSTHGTGCTLSAAIAAFIARGLATVDAVVSGRAYLQAALERAPGLGRGHGPLGHLDPVLAAPALRAEER